ncbi:hypothetical protein RJ641_024487, partial [Dillenia turbinata]
MCILCAIQKWSRRVATMLPWLVIPLIGLWALSQLLPPAFRFEITSPRLACVLVLLVTLFWYEVLMPQLSAWRMRRNARLRERKRFEAIELQKLRKTATRRCRNCSTPYRDQNPGGGRFMCSYCGHISKRPVLDLPAPPGTGITNSGIIKDLVGKGGNLLNGKVWTDNGWMCSQDWLENGNWIGGSLPGKSNYWQKNGGGFYTNDDRCLGENSYSGVVVFVCKLLTSFFLGLRWLWRKIFRFGASREDGMSDADRAMLAKRGENGTNLHESKGEKARRKAEEKRQARLEKELLEEEERKQREEVARLVEERRRLRDEKEAEKDRGKGSTPIRERDSKKEAEKKRHERRKDRDKGSSKSNSDAEEVEKRAGRESEQKREGDKRIANDRREHPKSGAEATKAHGTELGYGSKDSSLNNIGHGNTGARYLDRMRGTLLSSSKAFTGSGFFGKGANTSAPALKENKPNAFVEHPQASSNRRDLCPPNRAVGKTNFHGDDKVLGSNGNRTVLLDPLPRTQPKKSWQQLFTRSSTVHPISSANVISRPNTKSLAETKGPQLPGQLISSDLFDNPINFGLPSPFTLPAFSNGSSGSISGLSSAASGPMFTRAGEAPHDFLPEEPELFEDPCYVPDPVSLLGPVSESLDNFQLDVGTGFVTDIGIERHRGLKNIYSASEGNKPSPIESPMSRLRVADERLPNSSRFPSTPKSQGMHSTMDDLGNEKGTWQMWNSSPLGQDGLGLIGRPASWLLAPELNKSNKEDILRPSSHKTMASLFTKEEVFPGTVSPQNLLFGNGPNGCAYSPPVSGPNNHDPWLQNACFQPLPGAEKHFSVKPLEEPTQKELIYGSPSGVTAVRHPFEPSPSGYWAKKEGAGQSSAEGIGYSSVAGPQTGGIFGPQMYSHFGHLIDK